MSKNQQYFISYTFVTGIISLFVTISLTFQLIASQEIEFLNTVVFMLAISMTGIITSIYMYRGERLAFITAIIYFFIQVPRIGFESFSYEVNIGFNIPVLYFDTIIDQGFIGINFLAYLLLIWAYRCFLSNKKSKS